MQDSKDRLITNREINLASQVDYAELEVRVLLDIIRNQEGSLHERIENLTKELNLPIEIVEDVVEDFFYS